MADELRRQISKRDVMCGISGLLASKYGSINVVNVFGTVNRTGVRVISRPVGGIFNYYTNKRDFDLPQQKMTNPHSSTQV